MLCASIECVPKLELPASGECCYCGVCLLDSLFFLIPIALIFVVIATKVFFWAVNNGQYDDLSTEAQRILFDDEPQVVAPAESTEKSEVGVSNSAGASADVSEGVSAGNHEGRA